MDEESELYDVLIVGGGISGLTAAYELKKRADWLRILVLEAKERLGGRTQTVELRTADDGSSDRFDVGGQWVGGSQRDVLRLLAELRLDLYPQYVEGRKLAQVGNDGIRPYSDTVPNTFRAACQFSPMDIALFARFLRKVDALTAKLDAEDPFATPGAAEWDAVSVRQFTRDLVGDCVWVLDSVETTCKTVFGVSSDRLSMLYFLIYSRSCGGLDDLNDAEGSGAQGFRIVGGAQQISRRLAAAVGGPGLIRVRHPVIRIVRSDRDVRLFCIDQTDNSDTLRSFRAKRLILAMPPQQIGRLQFEPPLPDAHAQLFGSFPSGSMCKFVVTYSRPFWRQKGLSGEIFTCGKSKNGELPHPVLETYDATTSSGNAAIVGFLDTTWCGTDFSRRRGAVVQDLARFLGPEALDYVDYVDKNWSEEPYNGGCPVGVLSMGAAGYFAEANRQPVGVIHWAGTETARVWMGYMSGAVEAGQRAAHEVLAHLAPGCLSNDELITVKTVKMVTKKWACPENKTATAAGNWTNITIGVVAAALGYALVKHYKLELPIKTKFI